MQANVKISIIMPVYNVRDYLKRAVDSVLAQTFDEFELFLVDDGSTDGSTCMCDELAKKDTRINVLHQKNQGAHEARNNALKKASGEYVCFFDSDDFVDDSFLFDMYHIAITYNSDLVISGFYIDTYYDDKNYITLDYIPKLKNTKKLVFEETNDIKGSYSLEIENFVSKELFRKKAYKNFDRNMFYSPWNKLYNLKYLKEHNIIFPHTYRDDFPFVVSVIRDISNVTYVNKEYYHFIRKRSDSETQKYVSKLYDKREEEHNMMIDLYKYWKLDKDYDSFEMISRRYVDRVIECMTNLFNTECNFSKNEKIAEIKRYLSNENLSKCIKVAKPNKSYLKLMYIPLKLKNVYLCYNMAKFINFVKTKNIKLFSILKTKR